MASAAVYFISSKMGAANVMFRRRFSTDNGGSNVQNDVKNNVPEINISQPFLGPDGASDTDRLILLIVL